MKATLFKDEFARNETGTPFEFLGSMFLAVGGDIFLGNTEYHRPYFGPDAGTRAHGTRFVRGVQDEIRQIPTIAGGNIFRNCLARRSG